MKSETGSGKTLAFTIPLIQMMYEMSQKNKITRDLGTIALIIAPTRELSIQIQSVIQKVAQKFGWLISGVIMGGENKKKEKARIKKGIPILISTPGRLLDHLQMTQSFKYENLKFVIMDEADRLLDLGFEKKLNEIFKILKNNWKEETKPQVILTSATLNSKVISLSEISLNNPIRVGFDKSTKETFNVPQSIFQHATIVPCKLRLVSLTSFILSKIEQLPSKIIVFFSCCQSVEFHYHLFNKVRINDYKTEGEPLFNVPLFMLHGDMTQKDRTKIYFDFLKTESGILLCTDVASRGLDIRNVNWIVQYDPPSETKDYIHRIGRAGRLDHLGDTLLFLQPHEELYLKLLEKYNLNLTRISGESILESLIKTLKYRTDQVMEAANIFQAIFDQSVENDEKLKKYAIDAFISSMRAYGSHSKDTKYIFHVKNIHQGHLAKSFALKQSPNEFRKEYQDDNPKEKTKEKPNKLSVAEKLQRYKDFQKGRLPMRPKIQLPENVKRSGNLIEEMPRKIGGNTKRALYEMVSEFDSGIQSSKKRKQ